MGERSGSRSANPISAICASKRGEVFDEKLHHARIEVGTSAAQKQGNRFIARHATPEGSIFTNGVKAINYRDNARSEWDLFTAQSIGITGTIPVFMVVTDDGDYRIRKVYAAEQLRPDRRMNLHFLKLGSC